MVHAVTPRDILLFLSCSESEEHDRSVVVLSDPSTIYIPDT